MFIIPSFDIVTIVHHLTIIQPCRIPIIWIYRSIQFFRMEFQIIVELDYWLICLGPLSHFATCCSILLQSPFFYIFGYLIIL